VDALFGGFAKLTLPEFVFGVGSSILIIAVLWLLRHKLIISLFSPELAASSGINVSRTNLWFLLLFGLAILANLRFLGALLVGSLIIIPAAAARQLTHSLGAFLAMSIGISATSMLIGFFVSEKYGFDLGPTVVVAATAFFVISLLKKKK
jgi:ABC-type Mn2+/Zn2+ transport system permease subunit